MAALKFTLLISLLILFGCNQTILKSVIIDNIKQGDTLTLYAEYADCGEWGGHIEKIYLTSKEADLWVTFYKDTVSCDNDPNTTRKKIIEQSQILKSIDRNKVVKYINNFMLESKKEQEPFSNAANYFRIINNDTTFEFIDWKMDWKEFEVLRNEIAPTAVEH